MSGRERKMSIMTPKMYSRETERMGVPFTGLDG